MSRKKITALAPVLASLSEANSTLARIGEYGRSIQMIESDLAEKILALRKKADEEILPLATNVATLSFGLELYANQHREELLKDGGKTVSLSCGNFGWRWTPPKVSAGRGGDAKVLEKVQALNLSEYIRNTPELDKEALLRDKPPIAGVKYTQMEKFFIEPEVAVGHDHVLAVLVALPR